MVLPVIVNMLLLLAGFLTGLRKKSPAANRGIAGDSAASGHASSNSLKS
ncbi:MAG TPA: hypothetical protein VN948_05245 [Terriglobales bacterium]|nr:hypothetical protein [Terriglobales bacterium]